MTALVMLLLVSLSCVKESPTVSPADVITGAGGVLPGYYYPAVQDVYPANGSGGNPVNTKYVIVFNIPVVPSSVTGNLIVTKTAPLPVTVLAESVDYTLSFSPSNTAVTITFSGALPDNSTYSVDIPAAIIDAANGVSLNNPGARTFSMGTSSDTTAPAITGGTNTPTGTGISLTAPGIGIQFTETGEIDASTLNDYTFYVETGGIRVPATISYTAATNTANLAPTYTLEPGTTYTVHITTGIEDLSGNALTSGTTWTFDTTTTEIDPFAGAPSISSGIAIDAVTNTTADISWTTSEATGYTVTYGRNNGASGETAISDLVTFNSVHALTLNPPLLAGKRYYVKVDYKDVAGNAGATSAIKEFNTTTADTPSVLDGGAGNQHTLNSIANKWGTAGPITSGAFVFWTDSATNFRHIYGQRFNSAAAEQWAAGGVALSSAAGMNFYFISAVEDEVGGFILLTSLGGTGIYAKRFDAAGAIVNWGTDADAPTDNGFQIDAAGTSASAVPVYANTVENIASGVVEHGSLGLSNWFYEDDADLLSQVIDGDIVYDTAGFQGTTIDLSTVTPDFPYIIGQDSVQAVSRAAAEPYIIGDSSKTAAFTAADHAMNIAGNYSNGTNKVYSPHGFTFPGTWTLDVGDLVNIGTNYKRITAINTIAIPSVDTGTANTDVTNHLIDVDVDFTSGTAVAVNDIAKNTVTKISAEVTVVTATDLTLNADVFPGGNFGYEIYAPKVLQNSADYVDGVAPFRLIETGFDLVADYGAAVGMLAYNAFTGEFATILDLSDPHNALLDADIFKSMASLAERDYWIYKAPTLKRSSADAGARLANFLYDANAAWVGLVAKDDLVINTTASTSTTVKFAPADNRTLELKADIFTLGTENYEIYHEFCSTHPTTQSTFYEFILDGNLNATDGSSITLYDYKGISGTSDIPPANPLFDKDANFTSVVAPLPVADGDTVLNLSDATKSKKTAVTTASYAINAKALGLTSSIFNDGDSYGIIDFALLNTDFSNIVNWGTATSYQLNHLRDSSNAFAGVQAGDVVCNLNDNSYAMVLSVAANDLTLSRNAFDTGDERYILIRQRGVLYVWQNAGNQVQGKILSINSGAAPVELRSEFTIAGGTSPVAISDSAGGALVAYVDAAGEIIVSRLDSTGTAQWTTEVDTQTATAEAILRVMSDNAGGMVLLYQVGTAMRVQRISSSGARLWNDVAAPGPSGWAVGNPAGALQPDMVYDGGSDYVIVAVNNSGDIWAGRVNGAAGSAWTQTVSSATGNQQNPKIFLNGANTIVAWEDNRFVTSVGYGIFGMRINAATGVRDAIWYADATNTDLNGVAFVLNNYNEYYGNIRLVTYNNGAGGLLFWEDYRTAGQGSNLFYEDITVFAP